MSNLPPFSPYVTWRDYKIGTPTFDLTPIEKPDMSPFLVHMTGKHEILDILAGGNSPNPVPNGHGYLRATPPEHSNGAFDAPVVCFTESPTFSLDFFRYRSFRRWKEDQRFGIGFRKAALADSGVRPVIYLDDETTKKVITIQKSFVNIPATTVRETGMQSVIESIFPLVFPLLENMQTQGFMWEREWRMTDPAGFVFDHNDIEIVCCPPEEEAEVRKVLGSAAGGVQFVRTWREYSDVTDFLRRKQPLWAAQQEAVKGAENVAKRRAALRARVQQLQISINSLDSYDALVTKLNAEHEQIVSERDAIKAELQVAEAELEKLKNPEPTDGSAVSSSKDDMGLNF